MNHGKPGAGRDNGEEGVIGQSYGQKAENQAPITPKPEILVGDNKHEQGQPDPSSLGGTGFHFALLPMA
jgi:hypothetical protein